MKLFGCFLLFELVSVISSEVVPVCQYVNSSKFPENEGETNSKESFLIYKEMQKSKGDVGQKVIKEITEVLAKKNERRPWES